LLAPEYQVPSLHWPVVPAGAVAGACAWVAHVTMKPRVATIDTSSVFTSSLPMLWLCAPAARRTTGLRRCATRDPADSITLAAQSFNLFSECCVAVRHKKSARMLRALEWIFFGSRIRVCRRIRQ
jgi:hypothetical protein